MSIKSTIIALLCATGIATGNGVVLAEYDASALKKLFTDKKQRAQIDAVRSGSYSESGIQKTDRVKVSGYVTRSNGKSVVWLNNKNTLDGDKMGNVKIHQSTVGNDKRVTVSIDGETKKLKPGETWSTDTGVIGDNLK